MYQSLGFEFAYESIASVKIANGVADASAWLRCVRLDEQIERSDGGGMGDGRVGFFEQSYQFAGLIEEGAVVMYRDAGRQGWIDA